jgi:hypothetical protein
MMRSLLSVVGLIFIVANAACGSSARSTLASDGGGADRGSGGLGGSGGAANPAGGATSPTGGAISAAGGDSSQTAGTTIPTGGTVDAGEAGSSASRGGSSSAGGSTGGGGSATDAGATPGPDATALFAPDVPPPTSVVKATPPSLNFAEVNVGQVSPALDVTVTNTGPLVLITPTITGAGFSITGTTCGTAPVASCTVSVQFAPVVQGVASGDLTVAPGIAISLSGTGVQASWTIVPSTIPATLLVNQSAPITVTVTATSLTGVSCVPSGVDLTADKLNTTCGATSAADTTCVYAFTFKSATAGDKSDSIACSLLGQSRTVQVTPTVVAPASLVLSPPSGSFSAEVNLASVPIIFNLVNAGGSASGTLSAPVLAGANPDQFAITDNKCLVPLAALSSCPITVVFKPTADGTKTATLTVTDATPGATPASATLSGVVALSGPMLTITGATDLGVVVAGSAGTPTSYTITNSGQTASDPLTVAPEDSQLAIGSDLCMGTSLAPSKTCTFSLTFAPTSLGIVTTLVDVFSGGMVLASHQIRGSASPAPYAAITMGPTALDFGSIGVGMVGATKTFTVINVGNATTGALSVVKYDDTSSVGGASQYRLTTTCSAALAPSLSCQVVVTFSPMIRGSAVATIAVGDGTISTPTRTVTGTAL